MNQVKFAERCREYLSQYVPFRGKDCFVAGGFFIRFYHDLPIRDIDVYVNDDKYFETLYTLYMDLGFEVISHERDLPIPQRGKFLKFKVPNSKLEIDLINFHAPKDVRCVNGFDYMNCMSWMDADSCSISPHIDSKELIFNPYYQIFETTSDVKANNVLSRMLKYAKLGFEHPPEEIRKMYKCLIEYQRDDPRLKMERMGDLVPF